MYNAIGVQYSTMPYAGHTEHPSHDVLQVQLSVHVIHQFQRTILYQLLVVYVDTEYDHKLYYKI